MPTKKTVWECNNCGDLSDSEEEAKRCEETHTKQENMKIIEVSSCEHSCRFPEEILVEDEEYSGVLAEYMLKKIHSVEGFYEGDKDKYFK